MNRMYRVVSLRGSYLALLVLLIASCQKSDNFSAVSSRQSADEATVTASNDQILYYYSAASKKLYITEANTDLAIAQLDASVISNEKWMVHFPALNEVAVVVQKGASVVYNFEAAAGDLRVRQNYVCEGRKDSVNECRISGRRTVHVVMSPYRYCIPTQNATCQDTYTPVGTGTAYDSLNCTGNIIGSAIIYKWTCGS